MKRIKGWLARWRRGPVMRPVEVVSERELGEMFKHAPDSPSWKATLAVLDLETVAAVERCVDERLTNEQMRYRMGGVSALLEFKQALEDRAAEARRTEREEARSEERGA